MRNEYKILVRKLEGKRPLGRPTHSWEDDIKMNLKETGYKDVDWIHLAEDRSPMAGSCEHGDEPSGSTRSRELHD